MAYSHAKRKKFSFGRMHFVRDIAEFMLAGRTWAAHCKFRKLFVWVHVARTQQCYTSSVRQIMQMCNLTVSQDVSPRLLRHACSADTAHERSWHPSTPSCCARLQRLTCVLQVMEEMKGGLQGWHSKGRWDEVKVTEHVQDSRFKWVYP